MGNPGTNQTGGRVLCTGVVTVVLQCKLLVCMLTQDYVSQLRMSLLQKGWQQLTYTSLNYKMAPRYNRSVRQGADASQWFEKCNERERTMKI